MKHPSLLQRAGLLSAALALSVSLSAAWAADVALITDVDADREGLTLKVTDGAFDPILKLEPPGRNGLYQVIIEGDGVTFDARLSAEKLLKEVSRTYPELRALHLLRLKNATGAPAIRMILESSEPLQPQILANYGDRVQISLIETSAPSGGPESAASATGLLALPMAASANTPATLPESIQPMIGDVRVESVYSALSDADPVLQSAFADIRGGKIEIAEANLKKFLKSKPSRDSQAWASLLLGLAAQERNDADSAAKIWGDLIGDHRDFLPAYQKLIGLHIERRAYSDAELLLSLAQNHWPQDGVLNYQRGLLAEINNAPEQAVDYYTRALQQEPENPTYHYRLALVELKRKNLETARYELNRALKLSPDDPRLHKMLGYVHTLDKNPEQAMNAYARALNPDVMINYARLLASKKQIRQAVSIYEAVEAIAPENPDILFNLGMLYAEINQKQAAERTLHKFITLRHGQTDKRIDQAQATLSKLNAAS